MLVQRFYLGFKLVTKYQNGGKNNSEITSRVCTCFFSLTLSKMYLTFFDIDPFHGLLRSLWCSFWLLQSF